MILHSINLNNFKTVLLWVRARELKCCWGLEQKVIYKFLLRWFSCRVRKNFAKKRDQALTGCDLTVRTVSCYSGTPTIACLPLTPKLLNSGCCVEPQAISAKYCFLPTSSRSCHCLVGLSHCVTASTAWAMPKPQTLINANCPLLPCYILLLNVHLSV